jgi:hypothetical protein
MKYVRVDEAETVQRIEIKTTPDVDLQKCVGYTDELLREEFEVDEYDAMLPHGRVTDVIVKWLADPDKEDEHNAFIVIMTGEE